MIGKKIPIESKPQGCKTRYTHIFNALIGLNSTKQAPDMLILHIELKPILPT